MWELLVLLLLPLGTGRDKRKKNKPSKPGVGAEKTRAKTEKAEHKKLRRLERAAQGDEDDIDAILAGIKLSGEGRGDDVVVTAAAPPPSARTNFTVTAAHQSQREDELFVFGGEVFEANKTRVFSDFYRYQCKNNQWTHVESCSGPPPRSAHQAWVHRGFYYVFGGEFTSPNQERFHHYKDLWRCELATNQWEQLNLKGAPSARSGHRCALYKSKLVLFGGFFDSGKEVKYYNDLFELDLDELRWCAVGNPLDIGPSPRSACQLALLDNTLYLYGGYTKRQEDDGVGVGVMEKGHVYSDLWALDLATYVWTKVKRAGVPPGPRAGFTFAVHKKQAVMFGGVTDHEKDRGEIIVSEFYNEAYTFQMKSRRWFPLVLRTAKQMEHVEKVRRAEAADEPTPPPDQGMLLQDTSSAAKLHAAATRIQAHYRGHIVRKAVRLYRIGGIVSECLYSPGSGLKPPKDSPRPIGRINAGMAVRGSTLWLMGGMLEIGDVEIALDDVWSLDLNRLDCWRCHRELTTLPEDLRPQDEASDSSEWESDDGEGHDDLESHDG